MNLEKLLVGSLYTRVAAGVFGLLAGLGLVLVWSGFDEGHHWIRISAIICALLAGITGIYCSRAVFGWWMRFAKVLNGVATTIVFGLCYLVLVPFFVPLIWVLDPLPPTYHSCESEKISPLLVFTTGLQRFKLELPPRLFTCW